MSRLLCQKYKIQPRKKLGQHFLIDKQVLEKIIIASELQPSDVVLEIGPGLGILTKALAEKVKKVVAVEADKKIAVILKKEVGDIPAVQIVEADILKITGPELVALLGYKLIANLPYQITSPVLWKFLQQEPRPKMMVIMIQKEVAERICAKPGKMNLLAVLVQFYGVPKIIAKISQQSFWPPPKVESAILKITDINDQRYNIKDHQQFFQMVKAGFHCPRKQLQNNLADYLQRNKKSIQKVLENLKINPKIRAEDLSIQNWVTLHRKLI